MNIQDFDSTDSVNVVIINSFYLNTKLILNKLLSSKVFDPDVVLNIKLLIVGEEMYAALCLKYQFENCIFPSLGSIEICTNLDCITTEIDFICLISSFSNPFSLKSDQDESENVENCLQIIKICQDINTKFKGKTSKEMPVLLTDGLLTLHLIAAILKDVPTDKCFCVSYADTVAGAVLIDQLKQKRSSFNNIYLWSVDEKNLHLEIDKPIILKQTCACSIRKPEAGEISCDRLHLSDAWLKKEFIMKTIDMCTKLHPHGEIAKAQRFANALKLIWKSVKTGSEEVYCNIGVISNGDGGTCKGLPYIMPVILKHNGWRLNTKFKHNLDVIANIVVFNDHIQDFVDQVKHFIRQCY